MSSLDPLRITYEILQTGGPLAVSAIMFFMWWLERKRGLLGLERVHVLEDKILTLATEQTQATLKLEAVITNMQSLITQLWQRR